MRFPIYGASMNTPNQDLGVIAKSNRMQGISIALGISGGIGAVETVKVAREWRRHGAEVTAFFSPEALRFITPLSLEWATGRRPIVEAGPEVEHLNSFDLVVVAPATLNTLSKTAAALLDTPVTLLIAGQLGRKAPLLMVPTMNEQLSNHPQYSEIVNRLKSWGIQFFESCAEEGRFKMPSPEKLAEEVLRILER